jgi:hydrogenase expression/formation protein HypE
MALGGLVIGDDPIGDWPVGYSPPYGPVSADTGAPQAEAPAMSAPGTAPPADVGAPEAAGGARAVAARPGELAMTNARPGDVVLVSGPIGDHGVTIMLARGELDLEADLTSDTAALNGLVERLLTATAELGDADGTPAVRAMRDPTRGGVATVLNELAMAAGVGVVVDEDAVPVRDAVRGAAELLGIDPLYVACEGRLVTVVSPAAADTALAVLRDDTLGDGAAVIGRVVDDPPGLVLLNTTFGGTRIVDLLVGDPLPRIC